MEFAIVYQSRQETPEWLQCESLYSTTISTVNCELLSHKMNWGSTNQDILTAVAVDECTNDIVETDFKLTINYISSVPTFNTGASTTHTLTKGEEWFEKLPDCVSEYDPSPTYSVDLGSASSFMKYD